MVFHIQIWCEWPTVLSSLFKNLVKIWLYINVLKSNTPLVSKSGVLGIFLDTSYFVRTLARLIGLNAL